jgi:predicted TIM-barrel fold metal-dependent hydrolase
MLRPVTLALLVGAAGCGKQAPAAPPPTVTAAPRDLSPPAPTFVPMDVPRFDTHTHIEPGALPRAVQLLGAHKIVEMVNLSGGSPGGDGLEETLAEAKQVGHTVVFVNPDFREIWKGGTYGARMAAKIAAGAKLGAKGVKISKGLGLGYARVPLGRHVAPTRAQLVPVDDKGLDPMFETAGKLGLPIAIHTGDPKAFWLPISPANERFDELRVHPAWSFYNYPPDKPIGWEELYGQFERRVTRSKKTIFIGVHFGNDPEDPARVAQMLDAHPNLYIDTAARIPEIGRRDANHDPARLRAFFEKYQDRILFGTDVGVGTEPEALMLGSTGANPPGPADVERFFTSTWRWFETNDTDIPSPTPIQGRWNVDGIGLSREVLEKVYHKNAERLLGVSLDAKSP